MTPQKQDNQLLVGCLTALALIVLWALAGTVGWNYGVTEFVAAAGGHVGHVNVLDTWLAFVFVRALWPGKLGGLTAEVGR